MTTILAIDVDRWAVETYRANFPDVPVKCAPVSEFINRLPYADIIIGGPPCQPHSIAGKRKASSDARDCGPDFVDAVRCGKPRMFLMENVDGLLSSEGGKYFQRFYASMELAGYVVQYRVQNAVSFGVPQFRLRLWVWGIRRDLYVNGIRPCWPCPTHTWPPPDDCMFGSSLLPGVTVGEALGIKYWATECNTSGGMAKVPRSANTPCTTVSGGGHTLGGLLEIKVIGGGRNDAVAEDGSWTRHEREITNEPSTTITGKFLGEHAGAQNPRIVIYHCSDAMLQKHPPASPASPASPAPTVQAKWFKGGAEGLLRWIQTADGLWVRRLSPLECLRLQSGSDDFLWPEKIGKTAMYKIIGNGWACAHAAQFAKAMSFADPDSESVIDLFCGGGLGAAGWHQKFWSLTESTVSA